MLLQWCSVVFKWCSVVFTTLFHWKALRGTYVFGCLYLWIYLMERAFFVYIRPHRWNIHVPVVHMQGISNSRPPVNFQCITSAFNSNFRIRRNTHLSRHNFRLSQQLGISFVDCRISFVRIADFFYILYLSLKYCKLRFRFYLSSITYPLIPIF